MPTIDKVIGSEDTPKRADCSIKALNVVGKDLENLNQKAQCFQVLIPNYQTHSKTF